MDADMVKVTIQLFSTIMLYQESGDLIAVGPTDNSV